MKKLNKSRAAATAAVIAVMGAAVVNSIPSPAPFQPGGRIVDVSSYQGRPDWATAKASGIVGGIAKAGEGSSVTDSSFSYNWAELRRLHIWHTAYYFARPSMSCTGEADRFVGIVNAAGGFDSGPPVIDAEVAMPAGYVDCMARRVEADIHSDLIIVYTGPGTWPGGGRPANALLWVATYGSHPQFSGLWTTHPVAWQFTGDGIGPSPHCVPGIICGNGVDISTDYGMSQLLVKPPPVPPTPAQVAVAKQKRDLSYAGYLHNGCTKPVLSTPVCVQLGQRVRYFQLKTGIKVHCWGKHAQTSEVACKIARPTLSIWNRAAAASLRVYTSRGCTASDTSAHCGVYRQRYTFFTARAKTLWSQFV